MNELCRVSIDERNYQAKQDFNEWRETIMDQHVKTYLYEIFINDAELIEKSTELDTAQAKAIADLYSSLIRENSKHPEHWNDDGMRPKKRDLSALEKAGWDVVEALLNDQPAKDLAEEYAEGAME